MRMLVTGCAGFIGSHLSEELLARGNEVVGVDAFTEYYSRSIKEANISHLRDAAGFTLREVDLASSDLNPLLDGIDVVFHLAAEPGLRGNWRGQFEEYVHNNLLATQRLLYAATDVRRQPRKFVYASSSSIYGNPDVLPTNESLRPEPTSAYGVTKLAGEQLARLYWRDYGLPTVMLRYFSVYGPRQRPDMAFHRFICAALDGEPLRVFGSGDQTRDFTYVEDIVSATIAAAESPVVNMALNVGGGTRISVNTVVDMLGELLGRRPSVRYLPIESGEILDSWADTFLMFKLLGFRPKADIMSGLGRELQWLEEQRGTRDRDLFSTAPFGR